MIRSCMSISSRNPILCICTHQQIRDPSLILHWIRGIDCIVTETDRGNAEEEPEFNSGAALPRIIPHRVCDTLLSLLPYCCCCCSWIMTGRLVELLLVHGLACWSMQKQHAGHKQGIRIKTLSQWEHAGTAERRRIMRWVALGTTTNCFVVTARGGQGWRRVAGMGRERGGGREKGRDRL